MYIIRWGEQGECSLPIKWAQIQFWFAATFRLSLLSVLILVSRGFLWGIKFFSILKPPDKPPFPNSKFTWRENLNKNQLGIMWIPLKIAFTII